MPSNIEYKEKLRKSGLRPTKQRIRICEVLFNVNKTFHFTINDLVKMIEINTNQKISLATVYNTVHAFEKKGYLKEIPLEGNKTYFDTNTSSHHHFYDEDTEKLIDIDNKEIYVNKVPASPSGKSIKSVEVMVRIASDNHNQK